MKNILISTAIGIFSAVASISGIAAEGFSISEHPGENVMLACKGRPVIKLMTKNDKSSEESAHDQGQKCDF